MASATDRAALLAVSCSWCGAAPGEECRVRGTGTESAKGTRRYSPLYLTTLDGGAHDARWQTALSRPAEVITAAVPHPAPVSTGESNLASVGASTEDRPW